MYFKTYKDLNKTIIDNLHRIPEDVDLIVGIPRSGLMLGNLIALYLNLPIISIDTFINGDDFFSSWTTKPKYNWAKNIEEIQKILVVDDSINTGTSMNTAKKRIHKESPYADKCIYLAGYATTDAVKKVDIALEILNQPRIFQWNFMQHSILESSCCDIDGVLCLDPTKEQNDDGENYLSFIKTTSPKFRPRRKIGYLVTSRLEKYREATDSWLKDNRVEYGQMFMMNLSTAEERQRLGNHASFKASIYKKLKKSNLFIESEDQQARKIFKITGKPVYCTESQTFYCNERREDIASGMITIKTRIKEKLLKIPFIYYVNKIRNKLKNHIRSSFGL